MTLRPRAIQTVPACRQPHLRTSEHSLHWRPAETIVAARSAEASMWNRTSHAPRVATECLGGGRAPVVWWVCKEETAPGRVAAAIVVGGFV